MISTRDLTLFRIQRTLEVWSSMPIRAKSWLPRVSHGAGAGSAPPRVVVCLRGFAGKFTNLERTNPYVHAAITGGAALHTFESHAGVQCAPGELFYLRMGRQDSRQQGPTPNLSRPRHLRTMCGLVRCSAHADRVRHCMGRYSMHLISANPHGHAPPVSTVPTCGCFCELRVDTTPGHPRFSQFHAARSSTRAPRPCQVTFWPAVSLLRRSHAPKAAAGPWPTCGEQQVRKCLARNRAAERNRFALAARCWGRYCSFQASPSKARHRFHAPAPQRTRRAIVATGALVTEKLALRHGGRRGGA
jgi:hypothetical protein